ncbi:MAG: flagellar motor switch protein FliG, partial [Treponema sp.]|nr:flagellar motor switch protein FliG [Treponema sp.]
SLDLAKALKGEAEMVKEAIFRNMSEKAVQMLKEDMEYIGPVRIIDVKKAQEKISAVIWNLVESGEIDINAKSDRLVE